MLDTFTFSGRADEFVRLSDSLGNPGTAKSAWMRCCSCRCRSHWLGHMLPDGRAVRVRLRAKPVPEEHLAAIRPGFDWSGARGRVRHARGVLYTCCSMRRATPGRHVAEWNGLMQRAAPHLPASTSWSWRPGDNAARSK